MESLRKTLTKEYFQKLDSFEIALNRKIKQGFQGARRAAGKGSGVEFSDFKAYSPGDDVKRIDWYSYARFDKLFVKQFMEERQATFHIYIDTSRSMDFGAENKGYTAKALALSIAYICLKNTDRVHLYAFNDQLAARKEKISAKARLYEIMDFLDALPFGGPTNIGKAVSASPPGAGFSFLLSDFFSPPGYEEGAKALAGKGGALVQILSREEVSPGLSGGFRLEDSETGEQLSLFIDQAMRTRYEKALADMRADIKRFCAKQNMACYFIETQKNIVENLYGLLGRVLKL